MKIKVNFSSSQSGAAFLKLPPLLMENKTETDHRSGLWIGSLKWANNKLVCSVADYWTACSTKCSCYMPVGFPVLLSEEANQLERKRRYHHGGTTLRANKLRIVQMDKYEDNSRLLINMRRVEQELSSWTACVCLTGKISDLFLPVRCALKWALEVSSGLKWLPLSTSSLIVVAYWLCLVRQTYICVPTRSFQWVERKPRALTTKIQRSRLIQVSFFVLLSSQV